MRDYQYQLLDDDIGLSSRAGEKELWRFSPAKEQMRHMIYSILLMVGICVLVCVLDFNGVFTVKGPTGIGFVTIIITAIPLFKILRGMTLFYKGLNGTEYLLTDEALYIQTGTTRLHSYRIPLENIIYLDKDASLSGKKYRVGIKTQPGIHDYVGLNFEKMQKIYTPSVEEISDDGAFIKYISEAIEKKKLKTI